MNNEKKVVRETIEDVMKPSVYDLLLEKKKLEHKLKDKNTPFVEKVVLSGRIMRINQKIASCNIGKINF